MAVKDRLTSDFSHTHANIEAVDIWTCHQDIAPDPFKQFVNCAPLHLTQIEIAIYVAPGQDQSVVLSIEEPQVDARPASAHVVYKILSTGIPKDCG